MGLACLALRRKRLAGCLVEVLWVVEPRWTGALAFLDQPLEWHQRAVRRARIDELVMQQVDKLLVRALHLAHDLFDCEARHIDR